MKGHTRVTDEKIIEEYRKGKTKRQITKEWFCGIIRVRKVVRAGDHA